MTIIILAFFTLLGVNFAIWGIIGLIRFIGENNFWTISQKKENHSFARWFFVLLHILGLNIMLKKLATVFAFAKKKILNFKNPTKNISNNHIAPNNKITTAEVAAIIPAHNEELGIKNCIESIKKNISAQNIYVGSDASTDKTVEIAKNLGTNVYDIQPNMGKANVLSFLLKHYKLCSRYRAIIIVDADSVIGKDYLLKALPLFDDPQTAAVAVHFRSKWKKHWPPKMSMFFSAYRIRLFGVLQAIFRYGQTWKNFNVSPIVPGFASIYRSKVLQKIEINAPGLVIEDYNMTFEVHHKNLGKIAYSPHVQAWSQDPLNWRDYIKQVKRWNLGFWQTVRRHGVWLSFFWVALLPYILELFYYGFFALAIPVFLLWFVANGGAEIILPSNFPLTHLKILHLSDFLLGIFLMDYLLTIIIAYAEKKYILLLYGPFFLILRILDAWLFLYALPLAFTTKSDGRWRSPSRQAQKNGLFV